MELSMVDRNTPRATTKKTIQRLCFGGRDKREVGGNRKAKKTGSGTQNPFFRTLLTLNCTA